MVLIDLRRFKANQDIKWNVLLSVFQYMYISDYFCLAEIFHMKETLPSKINATEM